MNLRVARSDVVTYPIASNATITRGHAVELDSTNNVAQKMSGSGRTFLGIALGTKSTTAGNTVDVLREGVVTLTVAGTEPSSWLGAQVYWDGTNNQYTFSSSGNTAVGRVTRKDGSQYRVNIIPSSGY